ncbi:MAG: hypothetical protein JW838_00740 [Spirochaetes bacterium]|nr:hypothetical protein [Spirochaetota bacterium]
MTRILVVIMVCAGVIAAQAKEAAGAAGKKKPVKPVKKVEEKKSAPAERAAEESKWQVSEHVDEITDEGILLASVSSGPRDYFSSSPTLVIRVKGGNLEIFLNWQRYLDNEDIRVILRFDDGEPEEETWSPGTSGEACFSKYPGALLESLLKHRKLAVRVYNFEGTQYTEVFDISGLEGALKPYYGKYLESSEEGTYPSDTGVDAGAKKLGM